MGKNKKNAAGSAGKADSAGGTLSTLNMQDLSMLQHFMPDALRQPFARDIFLLKTNAAGSMYVEDIIRNLKSLRAGQKLSLVREPDNPHDKRAILIMNGEKKLGYIPRRKNGMLSRLMDAGKYLYATADCFVKSKTDPDYPDDALIISIYMKD